MLKQTSFSSHVGMILMLWVSFQVFADWTTLRPGLAYQDLATHRIFPWSHIHVFKIDHTRYTLDLMSAKHFHQTQAPISSYFSQKKAILAVNGGFFDHQAQPLGLRLGRHIEYHPMKPISWWGVFQIKHLEPSIHHYQQFKPNQAIHFAIQSGPRLIIHDRIPKLKPGLAERTAIGINAEHDFILVVTEHAPLSTTLLAEIMHAPPLACIDALNLDGGSSTQLEGHIGDFHMKVLGLADISDAILIEPI